MKKILSIATLLILILPSFSIVAYAVTGDSGTGATGPATIAPEENTTTETESPTDKTARVARVEDNKKKFSQSALTETLKKHIGEKCVAAQANLKAHRLAKTPIMDKYSAAYDKITAKLDETSAKLKTEGTDTAALNADIAVLKTKIATFKASITTFQQALKDLNLLDCKTDTAGFKASLEAARVDQQAVLTASKDVHAYLKDTVKPALQALKEIEDSKPTSTEKE